MLVIDYLPIRALEALMDSSTTGIMRA